MFKFSETPTGKFKVLHFRDIKGVEVHKIEKDEFANEDYPYTFQLITSSRKYWLASANKVDRDTWLGGI